MKQFTKPGYDSNLEQELTSLAAVLRKKKETTAAYFVLGARDRITELEQQKDTAYNERNRVISALAKLALVHGHQAGLAGHPLEDAEWDPEWRTIVFIDMPQPIGQVSWHIHDSERYLFASLPPYKGKWDGHTTEEKYARLEEDL